MKSSTENAPATPLAENNPNTLPNQEIVMEGDYQEPVTQNVPATTQNASMVQTPPVSNEMFSLDVDMALREWEKYQELTRVILDDSDYQTIDTKDGPKKFKKKSAFRKYRRAFRISVIIVEKEIIKTAKGRVKEANFHVRAFLPSGEYADGWGNASSSEGTKSKKPNHDIPATGYTRAFNRAVADLVGGGEVSAEEMVAEGIMSNDNPVEAIEEPGSRTLTRKTGKIVSKTPKPTVKALGKKTNKGKTKTNEVKSVGKSTKTEKTEAKKVGLGNKKNLSRSTLKGVGKKKLGHKATA